MVTNERRSKIIRRIRRKRGIRRRLFGTPERPRLSVFRSHRHIAAQLIDDATGRTMCASATMMKSLRDQVPNGGTVQAAAAVGRHLAEQARMHGIRKVMFDRNGRKYHGRIKALAEAARETGLEF